MPNIHFCAVSILPLAEHDWLKESHGMFGTHVLLSWPWHL